MLFRCEIRENETSVISVGNCRNLAQVGYKLEKTVNDEYVCFHIGHPQFDSLKERLRGIIYRIYLYQFKGDNSWLFFSSDDDIPNGESWNCVELRVENAYAISFSRRITYLLSHPYGSDCIDYGEIGFKSRTDCINKCLVNLSLSQCRVLPNHINVDANNNDSFIKNDKQRACQRQIRADGQCERKCHHSNCVNHYYTHKKITVKPFSDSEKQLLSAEYSGLKLTLMTKLVVVYADEPDTIFEHTPTQHFVEYACYTGGVISLWTGFSIISVYAYVKPVWRTYLSKRNINRRSTFFVKKIRADSDREVRVQMKSTLRFTQYNFVSHM